MIPALPIVGKILASFAASGVDALTSSAQKVGQASNAANLAAAANPADFTQALDSLDQSASVKARHAASVFADRL
jgi:hypothetical protein